MKTILLALAGLVTYGATITSGTINFAVGQPMTFDMQIDGTRVTGGNGTSFYDFAAQVMDCGGGCYAGHEIHPAFNIVGSSFSGFWGPANGSSRLTADGPTMTLQGAGVLTSTFSLTGQLCGDIGPGVNRPGECRPLIADITGSGTVSLAVALAPEDGMDPRDLYRTTSATFTFTEMPEPGTVVAAALGLVGVAFLRRRHRLETTIPSC